MSNSQNQKLAEIKRLGTTDHYFFAKNVLGYHKMQPVPHQELCDHIQREDKRFKLTLMPRGSFKSSVVTVAGAVFEILKNPNIRILVASETQKNAVKFVREIREHFEKNEKFRYLYGDWVNKSGTWRDYEFTVNKRTRILKESTVMAASLEKQTVVGQHFDLVIIDDPCSSANTSNITQVEKTLDFYRLMLSVLEPTGRLWIIGTRWSILDLYGHLIETSAEQFSILHKQAIDREGNLLMPNILTKDFLDEQKRVQGERIFSNQYMNIPISDETATFKESQLQYYETPPQGLIYFMTVDPAIAGSVRSDFSAIIVNGVDYQHNYWIHEAINLKATPHVLIDKIFQLVDQYKPLMCLGMEKYMLEKVLKLAIEQEMEKRNMPFPIKDLETSNRVSKEARIRALQPKFENKKVFIKKDQKDLIHQLLTHPQCRHDDLLDALKSQLQITYPSDIIPKNEVTTTSHLSQNEKRVWDSLRKIDRRKVRKTVWM